MNMPCSRYCVTLFSIAIGLLAAAPVAVQAQEITGLVGEAPAAQGTVEGVAPPGSISVIPGSPTSVGNCIPFANNTDFGFTGFIYRDVPAFNAVAGNILRFDLGALNTQAIQRNIFFGTANINPAPGVLNGSDVVSQGVTVDGNGWSQVVSESQVPGNPMGNTISGDYELTYTLDAPFNFPGGGLLIGFQGSPPASEADFGCEQVLVNTNTNDANPSFYSRFCNEADLTSDVLDDSDCGGTAFSLGGFILGVTSEPRATFAVIKTFDDGNTDEVEVTLSCNTGLPLEQSADISEGDGVNFVVVDFNDGEMDCTVTETSGPDGYSVEYFDGTTTSSEGCTFEGVGHGDAFSCRIDNELEEVDVEVTKVWIDENPQFNAQNVAGATWSCSNVAFPCEEGFDSDCDNGNLDFFGNPGVDGFSVFPDWEDGTTCSITEVNLFESGIEVDDSDCQGLVVFPGVGASCTIFNTRLFEGIPTLSQYGLGILALLMLGVGFVAYRRLV